jgi:hypothetical protein
MYFHHPNDQTESTVPLLNFLAKRRPLENMGTYGHLWEQMGTQRVQNLHLEFVQEGPTPERFNLSCSVRVAPICGSG